MFVIFRLPSFGAWGRLAAGRNGDREAVYVEANPKQELLSSHAFLTWSEIIYVFQIIKT